MLIDPSAEFDFRRVRRAPRADGRLGSPTSGHALIENRHGLVVEAMATQADGTAERDAAMLMMRDHARADTRRTLRADKGYNHDFITVSRALRYTPHVSQNVNRSGGSAIDARTTRHEGYAISQSCRPRIEPVFGWLKVIGGLRKVKLRGLPKVDWLFVFGCAAYNLKRLSRLRPEATA